MSLKYAITLRVRLHIPKILSFPTIYTIFRLAVSGFGDALKHVQVESCFVLCYNPHRRSERTNLAHALGK